MKYSSTTRLINTVIFALLAVGFGILGIYFGILYAPFLWRQSTTPVEAGIQGWGLSALLGVFGLAGFIVAGYGLFLSIRSILKGKDDELVRKSFASYVAIGYIIALFFLLNGLWLYRLTSSNLGFDDLGFVIVVFIVGFLIAMVVSNIPLVRLYGENEELNKIMRCISGPLAAVTFGGTLVYGLSFIILAAGPDIYGKANVSMELGVGALFFLVACALSSLAFLGYGKAAKQNAIKKLNGYLFEGSLCVLGAGMIVAGVIEYLFQSARNPEAISLVSKSVPLANVNYMDFAVMSWILGSVLVIASLVFFLSTFKGGKKEKPEAK